jgi:hypothetical protein
MDINPNTRQAKLLIAGGFADLLSYLTELENPIIVGRGYSRSKLLEAFEAWALFNNFDITEADDNLWKHACLHGFFRGTDG